MNKDPRVNRNAGMVCKTCMYFVEKVKTDSVDKPTHLFGRCRRNAPTMKGFVPVYGDDWCGEHRLDENKIA